MADPQATLVIPVYNQRGPLELVLTGLQRQTRKSGYEILICDDGSNDGTEEFIRDYKFPGNIEFRYVRQQHTASRAKVRNLGINNSKGDVLIFFDGDCIPCPEFVEKHMSKHSESDRSIVLLGSRFDTFHPHTSVTSDLIVNNFDKLKSMYRVPDMRPEDILVKYADNLNAIYLHFCYTWSCNISVKRSELLKVGGFDENYVGWGIEDVDLGYRLYKSGLISKYTTEAVIYHVPHRKAPRRLSIKNARSAINNGLYMYEKFPTTEVVEALVRLGHWELYRKHKRKLVKLADEACKLFENAVFPKKKFWDKYYVFVLNIFKYFASR